MGDCVLQSQPLPLRVYAPGRRCNIGRLGASNTGGEASIHDAFISYSRKDKAFAAHLHKALGNYAPPRDLLLPQRRLDVFRDEDDFTGTEYFQSVERHLKDSSKLIVLCSPAARASQFVNDEIERFALARGAEHIIALLVAGLPNNEATSEQSALMAFPDALCALLKMPLAADYRGFDMDRSRVDRGAYEASWYTTLANLYDISRTQIEERDRKRRARWQKIVVASVLAAGIVVGGLGTFGVMSSQEAKRERNLKVANTLAYHAARQTESDAPSQDLRRAALLAAESLGTAWTDGGYQAWRKATLPMPTVLSSTGTDQPFFTLAFSRDAKRLFALGARGADYYIHMLVVPDLRELHPPIKAKGAVEGLVVDAVGEQALAHHGGHAELFRMGSATPQPFHLDDSIRAAAFTPAGKAVVASLAKLWALDAATGQPVSRAAFPESTKDVVMSPDGATVLACTEAVLQAFDTASGEPRWQVPAGDAGPWHDALFSGDGRQVTIRGTASLVIVDATSGSTAKPIAIDAKASGKLVHFDGTSYVIGDDAHAVDGSWQSRLPFRSDPNENYTRLPVASPSGGYIAGTMARRARRDFAIFDVRRQSSAWPREVTRHLYLTLEQGMVGQAAAFSPNGDLLAVSAQAAGIDGKGPAALQLVSLKRQPWHPIIPGRWQTPTADFAVVPPDARVVVEQPTLVRVFDSVGGALEGATALYFSASGRLVAHREGREWLVTDTVAKTTKRIPDNGSPIEFSPDEQRVLVFPDIYALNTSDPPRKLAASRPFVRTSSYPGVPLVIGLHAVHADTAVLFNWDNGKISTGPGSRYGLYAISRDGKRLAAHDQDGIALWHVGDSKPTAKLADPPLALFDDTMIQFSPDGALLARGACPFTRLVDGHTLEPSFVLMADGCFAGFSPDGNSVVTSRRYGDFPEPTYHPITWQGVLAETCAKARTDVSPREQAKTKPAEATEAACRQAAAVRKDKAAEKQ